MDIDEGTGLPRIVSNRTNLAIYYSTNHKVSGSRFLFLHGIALYLTPILLFLSLSSCLSPAKDRSYESGYAPIFLCWGGDPRDFRNVTHYTPHVWLEGSDTNKPYYFKQEYLQERGIMPLDWRAGHTRANDSEDELVDYWCDAWEEGYAGIAIDEFGGYNFETNRKLGRALVRAKKRCPQLFIAVWHAGPLFGELGRAYKDGADLVMIETYFPGTSFLSFKFGFKLFMARMTGIVHKSVFALGINDEEEEFVKTGRGGWANSREDLMGQMEWITKNAPDMPGIALYASLGSDRMVREADGLVGEMLMQK